MPDTVTSRADVDRSMSLLGNMASAALDPAYAEVATRRAAKAAAGGGDGEEEQFFTARRGRRTVLAALLAAGVITGIAAAQVRRDARVVDGVRTSLVADVRQETQQSDALAREVASLRTQVADLRAQTLGSNATGAAAAQQLLALEVVTGSAAVHGPAVVVTLDDAARTDAVTDRGGQPGDGRVFDRDLQDVVNALWLSGAEAMSVNGQRLTAQTAIRSAGEAILVDLRPLTPPYVVRAIGDVGRMEPRFADSKAARRLQTLTSLYGVRFAVSRAADARLPAAADPDLRSVRGVTR